MAINPRVKGQFVQAGVLCLFPKIGGAVVSHDGTVACNTVLLQVDYPILFEVIGTAFNDVGKGDDPVTQFRTPPAPTWMNDTTWEARIRF